MTKPANAITKPKNPPGLALRLLRDVSLSAADYAQCVVAGGIASVPARIANGRLDDDLKAASEFLSKIDGATS
ncbi:hypothetical protein [Sulfuricystis thermophila]|uniref:hypothetical protein n=1 Tax=Sulfuricystis thermophila TaxID=2496847 RepID=UPI001036DF88|nr:hypothetical protein [Sulfuricystis thermophila]